jgi:hypothetical protein
MFNVLCPFVACLLTLPHIKEIYTCFYYMIFGELNEGEFELDGRSEVVCIGRALFEKYFAQQLLLLTRVGN